MNKITLILISSLKPWNHFHKVFLFESRRHFQYTPECTQAPPFGHAYELFSDTVTTQWWTDQQRQQVHSPASSFCTSYFFVGHSAHPWHPWLASRRHRWIMGTGHKPVRKHQAFHNNRKRNWNKWAAHSRETNLASRASGLQRIFTGTREGIQLGWQSLSGVLSWENLPSKKTIGVHAFKKGKAWKWTEKHYRNVEFHCVPSEMSTWYINNYGQLMSCLFLE